MIHSCIDHLYSGETPCPKCEEAWKGLTPITIEPSDLRIDTYRAEPHSAWTWIGDTGVRITHVPTGLSASCHEGRSVHRNRTLAMEKLQKMLQTHKPVKVPSDAVSVVGMPEFDALMDHIYEHGTASEGILPLANVLARALLARYGHQPTALESAAREVLAVPELAEMACTGSDAPAEHVLGLLADAQEPDLSGMKRPFPSDVIARREERQGLVPAASGEPWYGHKYQQFPGGVWKCAEGCGPDLYEHAPVAAQPSVPTVCDGKEQYAFEAWAKSQRMDMSEHPRHYLFLHEKTDAARQGWKAAIEYCAAAPTPPAADQEK